MRQPLDRDSPRRGFLPKPRGTSDTVSVVDTLATFDGGGRTYDLAICVEYAEHLPEARAASFIGDLTKLAPAIAFSAAIPGQGGKVR